MKFDYVMSEGEEGKEAVNAFKKCPACGKMYCEPPAISRKDHKTEICTDCGTLAALESIGASDETKAEVLAKIHEARKGAGV